MLNEQTTHAKAVKHSSIKKHMQTTSQVEKRVTELTVQLSAVVLLYSTKCILLANIHNFCTARFQQLCFLQWANSPE